MHISKLKIKNFKCFNEIEIEFDPDFNLIIGENNSGKSTIFEALRLWQIAFVKFLKDRTNNQQSSFKAPQYFSFTVDDLSFLRISDFKNLFFNKSNKNIEIKLTIAKDNNYSELPIIFTKTTEGQVLRFELCKDSDKRKEASKYLSKVSGKSLGADFKDLFLFTYINPIFHLSTTEPHFKKGYIINQLHQAKANEVIRNLLFDITPLRKQLKFTIKDQRLKNIESSLKSILFSDRDDSLSFSTQLEDEDVYLKIFAKNEHKGIDVEINQLGSGTINVLNILSVLAYGDYEKFKLNALLLDEPDSHLHSDHQKRLYEHLSKISVDSNKQIFVITHNHELIDSSPKVIYVDNEKVIKEKCLKPITNNEYNTIYRKLSKSYYEQRLEIIAKREIEGKLKKITKPILYCEGSTDIVILKKAFIKLYDIDFFNNEIDIEDGNSDSGVGQFIKSNTKKEVFIIGLLDNDVAGQNQIRTIKKNIPKPWKLEDIVTGFHYQKYYENIEFNTHALLLPIPEFRIKKADFFNRNMHIEYMFADEVLKEKLQIEMFVENGTTYEKIKLGDDGKIHNLEKEKVIKNINNLKKDDFIFFTPLFEKIAEITGITLPNNA